MGKDRISDESVPVTHSCGRSAVRFYDPYVNLIEVKTPMQVPDK